VAEHAEADQTLGRGGMRDVRSAADRAPHSTTVPQRVLAATCGGSATSPHPSARRRTDPEASAAEILTFVNAAWSTRARAAPASTSDSTRLDEQTTRAVGLGGAFACGRIPIAVEPETLSGQPILGGSARSTPGAKPRVTWLASAA
jgi:hypothetical protein